METNIESAQSNRLRYAQFDSWLKYLFAPSSIEEFLASCSEDRPFHLPPLPYEFAALEPAMDRESLFWHHQVLHRAHVENLNIALKGRFIKVGTRVEEVFLKTAQFPILAREEAKAHWNHSFFWQIMTSRSGETGLTETLWYAMRKSFDSFQNFQKEFVRIGMGLQGSGWIWLLTQPNHQLKIVTTRNQDNPLENWDQRFDLPLLACDLWEHCYYLQYKARREFFLRRFLDLIDWRKIHLIFIAQSQIHKTKEVRPFDHLYD